MKKVLMFTVLGLIWVTSAWALGPYTDNGDQTVTDQATGLMWDQRETSTMTWEAALAYCDGLNHANQTDWRLPNRNELESLVDDGKTNSPVISTDFFPGAFNNKYWTSTANLTDAGAWYVEFELGTVAFGNPMLTHSFYVRCVR